MTLALDSDPRTTKVKALNRCGTQTEAEIVKPNPDGSVAAVYRSAVDGQWHGGTWGRGGNREGACDWPKLINAPEEMEERTIEIPCANVYPNGFITLQENPQQAKRNAIGSRDALCVGKPVKITFPVPKPAPQEPVVVEGKLLNIEGWEGAGTTKSRIIGITLADYVEVDSELHVLRGRRCTIAIKPE